MAYENSAEFNDLRQIVISPEHARALVTSVEEHDLKHGGRALINEAMPRLSTVIEEAKTAGLLEEPYKLYWHPNDEQDLDMMTHFHTSLDEYGEVLKQDQVFAEANGISLDLLSERYLHDLRQIVTKKLAGTILRETGISHAEDF